MEKQKPTLLRRILKWGGIGFILLLAILIAIPLLFKGKIKDLVLEEANKTLLADVSLGDFDLTFLSSFPDMTVELTDTKITGRDEFANLPLIDAKTIKAEVKFWDVIAGDQIGIKAIYLENADIHVKVLPNGKANYDITVSDSTAVEEPEVEDTSAFKLTLSHYELSNCNIIYDDRSGDMYAKIVNLNHEGNGDLTSDVIDFETKTTMDALTYDMEGLNYLTDVKTDFVVNLLMEFTETTSKFTLKENSFKLNNFEVSLNGFYEMLENEDQMDLQLDASKVTFKELLSLIPSFYTEGYDNMVTQGSMSMGGFVKGKMNDTEMPAWDFSLNVDGASIQYPDVPGSIKNVTLRANSKFKGGSNMDAMTIDVDKLHADFVGNTIDMNLKMRNPMTDPLIISSIQANVDLSTLGQVMPLAEGEKYQGKLESDIEINGRLSAIEQERYEDFQAVGTLKLMDMEYASADLPAPVNISEMVFLFSPKNLSLSNLKATMGKSDFQMNGYIDNYLAYAFEDDLLHGTFSFNSNTLDLDDLMGGFEEETTADAPTSETTEDASSDESYESAAIPSNIDFVLNTDIQTLIYDGLAIKNVNGKVTIKESTAYLEGLNMNAMGGSIGLTGSYSTVNPEKPAIDFAYDLRNIDVEQLTKYFTSISTMAPVAKYAKGSITSNFQMKGLLNANLEPDYNSLDGSGGLFTNNMIVDGYEPLVKLADALKMDKLKKQTFKDLKARFAFEDGKVNLEPINTKLGKIPTQLSGYTSFEQDINYDLVMNIPKEEIPAGMIKIAEDGINKLNSMAPGLNVTGLPAVIPVKALIVGKTTSPKVTTDFKDAIMKASGNLKDDLKNKLNETKDKAIDSAKAIVNDKVEDVKEDIEAKKQQILADAQAQANKVKAEGKKAADAVRAEGDRSAKKLMDEAGNNPIKKKAAEVAGNKVKKEAEEKAQKIEAEANKKADDIMSAARKKAEGL